MAKTKKKIHKSRQLIQGYLESISTDVFSDFPKVLTDLVGREHEVYALYKHGHLYYIGLAGNLRNRIKNHLRDKHAGKWDSFSLYLVRKADHIRELESLILRISDPKGNRTRGKLPRASDLRPALRSCISIEQKKKLGEMFKTDKNARKRKPKNQSQRHGEKSRQPSLAPYTDRPFTIRRQYKGKKYLARVRRDGRIHYDGVLYDSPSGAARALAGHSIDGWFFWHVRNSKGEWVKLDSLRKK